ncbi:unnamed protein product [Periconia digitata]|uniref:Uncharacterized protein n=1 Tax=Periconia digitata TaxID=1303443 RepID=A0A9W4ULA9_9PLEO|nr:unnamed protein product [Periconia digitata]
MKSPDDMRGFSQPDPSPRQSDQPVGWRLNKGNALEEAGSDRASLSGIFHPWGFPAASSSFSQGKDGRAAQWDWCSFSARTHVGRTFDTFAMHTVYASIIYSAPLWRLSCPSLARCLPQNISKLG